MQDGTFNGSPWAITQTTEGYIWVGTTSGLLRFDGVRFAPWDATEDKRLASASIHTLLGASDGSLWISSHADNLLRWKDRRLTRIQFPTHDQPRVGNTFRILEKNDGSIWTTQDAESAGDGRALLCRVDVEPARCYGAKEGIPIVGAALAADTSGNLWIGSFSRTEVVRWNPNTPVVYRGPGDPKSDSPGLDVLSIAVRSDGSAWIGMDGPGPGRGLQRLANGVWQPLRVQGWDSSAIAVTRVRLDRHGSLWIGTVGEGIYRFRDGEVEHFGLAEGLTGNTVKDVLEDREGDFWIITDLGVDCFRQLKVASYSQREGLSTPEVDSVLATKDGTIWVGGDRSLDALRGRQIHQLKSGQGLPGTQVTSMVEDHRGRLWVGIDNDLTLYKGGRFVPVQRRDSQPVGWVTGLAEDVAGNIWAAVSGQPQQLLRIRDLQVQEELGPPRVPAIRKVKADPQGGIWLGLMSGDLARYRNGRTEIFRFPHTAESYVRELEVRSDGAVLGATEFGLLGWRERQQQIMTTRNGLPSNSVQTLTTDARGDLWLYTQLGLVQIASEELTRWWGHPEAILRMRVFDAADGAHGGHAIFNGSARGPDGMLWFAMAADLQAIDPAQIPINPTPPSVHIEEVVADHRRYFPTDGLRLPPRTRDLALRYTAPSFVATQKVHFRYKLEGQDTEWQEAGTRREAFYTNLEPGSYTFRVIACNNDGVWNKSGAVMSVIIPPTLLQTNWFRAASITLALALLWLLYQLRLRRLRAEHQARLTERLSERERIARELHDTLLQGVQGLVLRFQVATEEVPASEPARQMLEHSLNRADQVLNEGRERVLNLRMNSPESGELASAFEEFGESLADSSAAKFSVTVKDASRQLHPIVREEIERIGREAITNAFRHAEARTIEVEISCGRAEFQLRICDDGRGIQAQTFQYGRPGHWGLPGMRERSEQIGASLKIGSRPGGGTEVKLTLPARTAYRTSIHGLRWHLLRRTSSKTAKPS